MEKSKSGFGVYMAVLLSLVFFSFYFGYIEGKALGYEKGFNNGVDTVMKVLRQEVDKVQKERKSSTYN